MLRQALGLAVVAGIATAAGADVTFSFASDNDHTSFTFGGFGQSVWDAQDTADPFTLLIDDANGGQSPLSFQVEFDADFAISYVTSVPMGGGLFVHTYSLGGEFGFYDLSGAPILTATVRSGALTALGLQTSWSSAATVFGADSDASDIEYVWHLVDDPGYGLFTGASVGPADDAAFTLTYLQSGSGSGVILGTDMLPGDEWLSEGSYSGAAAFVPAPGSAAILVGAGLLGPRRRR